MDCSSRMSLLPSRLHGPLEYIALIYIGERSELLQRAAVYTMPMATYVASHHRYWCKYKNCFHRPAQPCLCMYKLQTILIML